MEDPQPPVTPEFTEPELTPITFKDQPTDVPGLLKITAAYRNESAQEFLVTAIAEEQHHEDLDEYREGRLVWFQAFKATDVQSDLAPRGEDIPSEEGLEALLIRSQREVDEEVTGAVAITVTLASAPDVDEATTVVIVGHIDPIIPAGALHCYGGNSDYVTVSADNRVTLGGVAGGPLSVPPRRTNEYANNSCWIYGVRRSTYSINLRIWHRV